MIGIQEQFQVNIGLPIDARIVASGSSERDSISYKYDGLLVYDTSVRKTFAWNADSATWSQSDISGSGTTNYVTKWSSSGLSQAPIFSTGTTTGKVGINTNNPREVLQINSDVTSSQAFVIHQGSSDTILAKNWWNDGSDQYFGFAEGSSAIKFKNNGEILFYMRQQNQAALNSSDDSINELFKFSFSYGIFKRDIIVWGTTGLPPINQYALFLKALTGLSSATAPDVTWYNDDQTGIYHPAAGRIGISISGAQKFIMTNNGLLLSSFANITSPNHKLQIDSGNGAQNFLQFTNGTTTGVGSNNGFLVGLNSNGWPEIKSMSNLAYSGGKPAPILINFGGNYYQNFKQYKITTVAKEFGVGFADLNGSNGGSFGRVERISFQKDKLSENTNNKVYELEVANYMWVTIDVTFTSYLRYNTSSYEVRSNKVFKIMKCDGSGQVTNMVTQTTPTPVDILTSGASSRIYAGTVDPSASTNKIDFNIQIPVVSGYNDTTTIINAVVIFNSFAT